MADSANTTVMHGWLDRMNNGDLAARDELLRAFCDRLETQQKERETRHAALARASLARFADAPTPANLNFIFHKSYDITPADLRKTILTLAVQGKLVAQDPNDELPSVLLERIREHRAQQAEATKRQKKTAMPQRGNKTGKVSSRPTPQQMTLAGVLIDKGQAMAQNS